MFLQISDGTSLQFWGCSGSAAFANLSIRSIRFICICFICATFVSLVCFAPGISNCLVLDFKLISDQLSRANSDYYYWNNSRRNRWKTTTKGWKTTTKAPPTKGWTTTTTTTPSPFPSFAIGKLLPILSLVIGQHWMVALCTLKEDFCFLNLLQMLFSQLRLLDSLWLIQNQILKSEER